MRTINIPDTPLRVGTTIRVDTEWRYIADIIYSTVEDDWLIVYHIVDNNIIKSTQVKTVKEFM